MPLIFGQSPGIVGAYLGPSLPAIVQLTAWNKPARFKCAITGHSLQGQGVYQWMQTLREMIYTYVFGERMVDLVIQGVTFLGTCGGGPTTGLDDIFNYYNNYRLSTTGGTVSVSLGAITSFNGFLVAFAHQLTDPASGVGAFSLVFKCPPKNPSTSSPAPGGATVVAASSSSPGNGGGSVILNTLGSLVSGS